jgi:hypothetical protein
LASSPWALAKAEGDTPGRSDEALTTSMSSKPMLLFSLEIAMITFLIAAWYVLHRIAHVIVTEYGLLGGVITCGVLYAIGLVMDRYEL